MKVGFYFTPDITDSCMEGEIASSDGALLHQSTRLGTYVKENYTINGRLVYKHKSGTEFLYWMDRSTGFWMVKTTNSLLLCKVF